jgi:hypothetical protein
MPPMAWMLSHRSLCRAIRQPLSLTDPVADFSPCGIRGYFLGAAASRSFSIRGISSGEGRAPRGNEL